MAVVYNVSQNLVDLLCTIRLIVPNPGWAVVYNALQNQVGVLCTMQPIIATPGWAVVEGEGNHLGFGNQVVLLRQMG